MTAGCAACILLSQGKFDTLEGPGNQVCLKTIANDVLEDPDDQRLDLVDVFGCDAAQPRTEACLAQVAVDAFEIVLLNLVRPWLIPGLSTTWACVFFSTATFRATRTAG